MTEKQYAPAVLKAGQDLGISQRGIVIGFATVYVESNWVMYANPSDPDSENYPHEADSADANSDGLFQQRAPWWGTVADRMDPYKSAVLFFTALKARDYNNTANSPGSYAQSVQQSEFPDRYDARMADAQALYNSLASGEIATPATPTDPNRPDYNEFPMWSGNEQDRAGTKIDLFLLHTQEPGDLNDDDAAVHLAQFLIDSANGSNPVSYHYTIRQASDGGVTVVDVIDTDDASWSVEASNNRAINLCFAGSSVNWSRKDWLTQSKAIDVAAYLAVQDCVKYGIAMDVIPGPAYGKNPPGISDHRYCSNWLKDGNNHDDVGDNFPWDIFGAAVTKYALLAQGVTPPNGPPVVPPAFKYPSQEDMIIQTWEQLFGFQGKGFSTLFGDAQNADGTPRGKYTVEAISDIQNTVEGLVKPKAVRKSALNKKV